MSEEEKPKINPLLDEVKAERLALEKVRNEAREEANRLEQLRADQLLSGTAGGRPDIPQPTEQDLKKKEALEFWKGTSIANAIEKYG